MAWYYQRLDRLRQIVSQAVKLDKKPTDTGFADFVLGSIACFGLSPACARGYIETLLQAYRHDKWKSYLQNNTYLTEEEKQKWLDVNSH